MIHKPVVLSAALAAAALFLMAGSATAGNSDLCGPNKVCIYTDNGYSGLIDTPRPPGEGIRNVDAGDNDKMDSWENRTATRAAWYHDANGRGDCINMLANHEDGDINVFDSDELTSWRTDRGC